MKNKSVALFAAALMSLSVYPVEAGSRYGTPPPTALSPDLASPWLLQLKQQPKKDRPKKVQNSFALRKSKTTFFDSSSQTRQWRHSQPTGIFAIFGEQESSQQPVVTRRKKQNVVVQPTIRKKKKQNLAYASQPTTQVPVPSRPKLDPKYYPQNVNYDSSQKPGTIIVDTNSRYLYLVMGDSKARR